MRSLSAGRGRTIERVVPLGLRPLIRDPHAVDPRTAMPETGVTEADARDIAAYLYTLH